MSVSAAWAEMQQWMERYAGGNPAMLILAAIALIYLLAVHKTIRKTIIIPILVLIPVVINPILYKYVYKDLRYWRFFWILPEAILIGWAFADIIRRMKKEWAGCLALVVAAGVIILLGQNIFLSETNTFIPAENAYKIDQIVKQNCDIILADNPYPKCIFQEGYTETRQYSGYITQMYGRDVEGYIMGPSKEAEKVSKSWNGEPEEQEYIFTVAQEQNYTHICCKTTDGYDEMAGIHGFSVLSQTDEWTIYHRKQQEEDET